MMNRRKEFPPVVSFGHNGMTFSMLCSKQPSHCHLNSSSSIIPSFANLLSRISSRKGTGQTSHGLDTKIPAFWDKKFRRINTPTLFLTSTTNKLPKPWTIPGKRQPSPPATCTTANPATTLQNQAAAANPNAQPLTCAKPLAATK